MTQHRLYTFTHIARPLEPAYPTNKAILALMLIAALAAGVSAFYGFLEEAWYWAALRGSLAVFGAWALARELAPDEDAWAFLSAGLAFAVLYLAGVPALLPVFLALFLVRIVNHTVGPQPRASDLLLVAVFSGYMTLAGGTPFYGLAAAVTFFLDGLLTPGRRLSVFLGLVLLGLFGWMVWTRDLFFGLADIADWEAILGLAIIGGALMLTSLKRKVRARGDATGAPLRLHRVKTGMGVGLIVTLAASFGSPQPHLEAGLLWAVLAGLVLAAPLVDIFRIFQGQNDEPGAGGEK